jgi:signal peptidase I
MSGSGSRDGSGSPPWDPAEAVPDQGETQAIPGLGSPGGYRADADGVKGPDSKDSDSKDTDGADDTKNTKGRGGKHRRRGLWGFVREFLVLIVIAVGLAFIIKEFAVQAFYIPSSSMETTLDINDRVLINKIVYHLRPIHRGDIIVFDGNGSWSLDNTHSSNILGTVGDELKGIVGITSDPNIFIKRVIGLPGDHVICCNSQGQLTVNGVPLTEGSYLYPGNAPSEQKFDITVPAGRLWVMGDHREVSYDSRGHMGYPGGGTIPVSGVIGRAFVIVWPPSRWGVLNIPATFEQPRLNATAAAGGDAAAGGSSAALAAALTNGTPIRPAASPLPLALGFVGAVPLSWLQRRVRRRLSSLLSDRE